MVIANLFSNMRLPGLKILFAIAISFLLFIPVFIAVPQAQGFQLDPSNIFSKNITLYKSYFDITDTSFSFRVRDSQGVLDGLAPECASISGQTYFEYTLESSISGNAPKTIIPPGDGMDLVTFDYPSGWKPVSLSMRASKTNTFVNICDQGLLVTSSDGTSPLAYIVPPNGAPSINSIDPVSINENDTYSATGSFSDNDTFSTSWAGTVDYGDGSVVENLNINQIDKNFPLVHVYKKGGSFTITIKVTDNATPSLTGTGTVDVTVHKVYELDPSTVYETGVSNEKSIFFLTDSIFKITLRDDTGASVDGFLPSDCLDGPNVYLEYIINSTDNRELTYLAGDGLSEITFDLPGGFLPRSIGMRASKTTTGNNGNGSELGELCGSGLLVDSYDSVSPLAYDPASNTPPVVKPISNTASNEGSTFTAAGSFTDMHSKTWTATVDYGDGSGVQPLTLDTRNFSLSHKYTTAGNYNLAIVVTDNQGLSGTSTTAIKVNGIPHVNSITPASIYTGDTFSQNGLFTDPDQSSSWSATVDYGDGSGVAPLALNGKTFVLNHAYTNKGQFTVIVAVTDNQNATGTAAGQVTVINKAPQISSISGATINEGATYSGNGAFTDTDSTSWTATVNYGDGSGVQSLTLSGKSFSLSHVYKNNGVFTVTVKVIDNSNDTGTATATVTVNNVAPTVGTITAPVNEVAVNTAVTASAGFTDPGVLDTHTAVWDWGDGTTSNATVTESNGSGSVSNTHTYSVTGVYTVKLTVNDNNAGTGTKSYQYVYIYKPTATGAFKNVVTYPSPLGADKNKPTAKGNVTLDLKFNYSGTNPAGTVGLTTTLLGDPSFQNFKSTSVSVFVISGKNAFVRGKGIVNGSGNYNFLITGKDVGTSSFMDLVRIQIIDSTGKVIYDTQAGAEDTAVPNLAVVGNFLIQI